MTDNFPATVGTYLAARLEQIGLRHYFAVPGDYNLVLLDELSKNPRLKMISCCNELNAGYAADGYARATGGAAAVVVTFSVGGLSVLNAIAGAYAEDLPLIAISGGPNTNSEAECELLHHTLGALRLWLPARRFSPRHGRGADHSQPGRRSARSIWRSTPRSRSASRCTSKSPATLPRYRSRAHTLVRLTGTCGAIRARWRMRWSMRLRS